VLPGNCSQPAWHPSQKVCIHRCVSTYPSTQQCPGGVSAESVLHLGNCHMSSRFTQTSPLLGSGPRHALLTLTNTAPPRSCLHFSSILSSSLPVCPFGRWHLLEGADCVRFISVPLGLAQHRCFIHVGCRNVLWKSV